MSQGWYPIIDYDKCAGCMVCNDMCKHGVYKPDPDSGKPKVVYGTGCVHGCHGCERKCPMDAIHYFGDDGTLDIDYDFESYRPQLNCTGKPKVAFICVHNSCRSQIAEALGKKLASDVFESYSAGTETKPRINPDAVRLMKQVHGIDMEAEGQHSKLLAHIPAVDVVITMGCNEQCPFLPCSWREDWGLEDPTGKPDEAFLETIARIEEKILELRARLGG